MPQTYGHFCPVARTLEKIGDKWSLLIIRDLLSGPQRFTDLLGYLHHITPKWLTQRLRELESSGIIERDKKPGRRQVWYRLTEAGRDLAPIVDALADWGYRYAMRPPLPGEVINPDLLVRFLTASLNKKGKRLTRPARWSMQFPQSRYSLSFHDGNWSSNRGEDPKSDLKITTTPEIWATVFTAPRSDRSRLARTFQIDGTKDRLEEFLQTFGLQDQKNRPFSAYDVINAKPKNLRLSKGKKNEGIKQPENK
jgi:DNA-binding HxlR family transcriptional regulator